MSPRRRSPSPTVPNRGRSPSSPVGIDRSESPAPPAAKHDNTPPDRENETSVRVSRRSNPNGSSIKLTRSNTNPAHSNGGSARRAPTPIVRRKTATIAEPSIPSDEDDEDRLDELTDRHSLDHDYDYEHDHDHDHHYHRRHDYNDRPIRAGLRRGPRMGLGIIGRTFSRSPYSASPVCRPEERLAWYERIMPECLLRMTSSLTGYETRVSVYANDYEYEMLERRRRRKNKKIRRRFLAVIAVLAAASAFAWTRGRLIRRLGVKAAIGQMKNRIEDGLAKSIHNTMGK